MIWIGTSGYNYPEWKGHFYPAGMPGAEVMANAGPNGGLELA